MADVPDFDDVDRAILHALQIDARAPFRRIGEVLGVSDQTVARRYARLRERGSLRVSGLADPAVLDDHEWLFHLRTTPDGAFEVADGLAARPDTSWIARCAGGALIVGAVFGAGAEPLLLETLPRTRQVLDVRADRILRVFYGGVAQPYTKVGPLNVDQVDALARHVPGPADAPGEGGPLDPVDQRLIAVLRVDGRATVDQLVEATGSSTSTAVEALGVENLVLGTDFPYSLDDALRDNVTYVRDVLTDPGDAADVLGRTAARLLGPRATTATNAR